MIKLTISLLFLSTVSAFSQNHFSGINTSRRVGFINATFNPAELANLSSKYEIQIFSTSVAIANNKVGINDLNSDTDFEELVFRGSEPVNMRVDGIFVGPGFAMKVNKWSFGANVKAYAKADLIDVDVNLGDAIANNGINILGSNTVNSNYNQRVSGTSWGEVGFLAARNIYEDQHHLFNAGITLKLLFPGSYTNFGADQFSGTITNNLGDVRLSNANATLNIAYSGNLGENFTDAGDYTSSLFGKLNGFAADFGVNYQLKSADSLSYRVNAGMSVRNLGSMTFKDNNNAMTNYVLSIQGNESLDMNVFDGSESLQDVEQVLLDSGFLDKNERTNTDFKVKLPTVFTAYADVMVVPSFYVTLFTQQKMNKDSQNDQVSSQNVFSITPRYSLDNFEVWSPWSSNEISGLAGGIGLRAYGFYIGSGSIITALISDAKEADVFLGYSFGLR